MSRCDKCLKRPKKEAPSTTKKVLTYTLSIWAIWVSVIIFVWAVWGREGAGELVAAVTVVAAVVIGFYEWKAKCENMAKYGKKDDITMN